MDVQGLDLATLTLLDVHGSRLSERPILDVSVIPALPIFAHLALSPVSAPIQDVEAVPRLISANKVEHGARSKDGHL